MELSLSELLSPVDISTINPTVAPLGFMIIEKLMLQAFGNSEYILRLPPFLFGIASIFLFYKLVAHYLKPRVFPIALGLFAISHNLIYYSAEVKPYSSDVCIALLLIHLTIYIQSKELSFPRSMLYGILWGVAIWFSFASLFILAGIGLCSVIFNLCRGKTRTILRLSVSYFIWMMSFGIYYYLYLRYAQNNTYLQTEWTKFFMPFPPLSLSDVGWYVKTQIDLVKYTLSMSGFYAPLFKYVDKLPDLESYIRYITINISGGLGIIATVVFLIGCISMYSEKRENFIILVFPIFFTLIASGLQKYPFCSRLILFLVPSVILLIAEGVEKISSKNMRNSVVVIAIISGFLISYPLLSAGYHIENPRRAGNLNPVVEYISEHREKEDVILFSCVMETVCEYYFKSYEFNNAKCFVGVEPVSDFLDELNKLPESQRVWILFSSYCNYKGLAVETVPFFDAEESAINYLDSAGKRLDTFKNKAGTTTYLYDISKLLNPTSSDRKISF